MTIPKAIHQIWMDINSELNPAPHVPHKYKAFMKKWQAMHPDYHYKLWTGYDMREYIKQHYPKFLIVYDAFPTWIYRCDTFRYLLLERDGGVYIDADMEPVKHISALVDGIDSADYDAMMSFEKGNKYITNAVIASKPRTGLWHDYLKWCVLQILHTGVERYMQSILDGHTFQNFSLSDWHDPAIMDAHFNTSQLLKHGCVGILETVGVYKLTEFMSQERHTRRIRILDDSTVLFPWSQATTSTERRLSTIPDATVAIHHFASTWFRKNTIPLSSMRERERERESGFESNDIWMSDACAKVIKIWEPRRMVDMAFYQGDVFSSNMTLFYDTAQHTLYAAVKQHNQKFPLGNSGNLVFWTCIWEMDPDTYAVKRTINLCPESQGCPAYSIGRQDPRLFARSDGGGLSMLCNYYSDESLFKVTIQDLDAGFRPREYHPVFQNLPELHDMHQKNWCPFQVPIDGVKFVFNVYPELAIGSIAEGRCTIEHVYNTRQWIDTVLDYWCPERVEQNEGADNRLVLGVHGGTNLVHIPEKSMFVGIMHIKDAVYCRYSAMWYALSDKAPFCPIGCSMPFRLDNLVGLPDHWDVVFCPGLERIQDRLVGSFSQNDERMVLFEMQLGSMDWLERAVHMHEYAVSRSIPKAIGAAIYKPNRMRHLVITGMPRSGTHYILDLFDKNTQNFTVLEEPFNTDEPVFGRHICPEVAAQALALKNKQNGASEYVKFLLDAVLKGDKTHCIMKVLWGQLSFDELVDQVIKEDSAGVCITTRNPLYGYISFKKAQKTEGWFNKDYSTYQIQFDPEEFKLVTIDMMNFMGKIAYECRRIGKPVLWLNYEQVMSFTTHAERLDYLVQELQKVYAMPVILSASASQRDVQNAYVKQNNSSLMKDVVNLDEMMACLSEMDMLDFLSETDSQRKIMLLIERLLC